jgi:hypothetical protein
VLIWSIRLPSAEKSAMACRAPGEPSAAATASTEIRTSRWTMSSS